MRKGERITLWLEKAGLAGETKLDKNYAGFFLCFNRGDYYEAHDVLEQLWLKSGPEDNPFYKGLIQLAGALVHLKKHAEHPDHPLFANRLRPASRLFARAQEHLAPFAPEYRGLRIEPLLRICKLCALRIERSDYRFNPYIHGMRPKISLLHAK